MIKKANVDEMRKHEPMPGVTQRAFSGKKCMMVLSEVMPGTAIPMHSHPHEQIAYFLEGTGEFTLGEDALKVGKGDAVSIPPNVPHGLKVIGDTPILNLDIFSPVREDYLSAETLENG